MLCGLIVNCQKGKYFLFGILRIDLEVFCNVCRLIVNC